MDQHSSTTDPTGRPSNAGKPWSLQEDEALRDAFRTETTIPDLANQHGRTVLAITARLMRLGLFAPPAGQAPAALAGAGLTASEQRGRPRAGKAWTEEEDRILLEGCDGGTPLEELAGRLGRGTHALHVRLFKLGRSSEPDAAEKTPLSSLPLPPKTVPRGSWARTRMPRHTRFLSGIVGGIWMIVNLSREGRYRHDNAALADALRQLADAVDRAPVELADRDTDLTLEE